MPCIRANVEDRHSRTAVLLKGRRALRLILAEGNLEVGFAKRPIFFCAGKPAFPNCSRLLFWIIDQALQQGSHQSPVAFRAAAMWNPDMNKPPQHPDEVIEQS